MFPLDLKTPTDEGFDPTSAVAEALHAVILLPGQEAVMCGACGRWWVTETYEYMKYGGATGRFPRIPSCPHCDLDAAPAGDGRDRRRRPESLVRS